MAHFAKIKDNKVTQVIVVSNDVLEGKDFPESEPIGQQFIASINLDGTWKQTSYNHKFRNKYAGIGDTYDAERNAFIPQKPFNSWVLNEDTCNWDAPISYPQDGKFYLWNEELKNWEEEVIEEPVEEN